MKVLLFDFDSVLTIEKKGLTATNGHGNDSFGKYIRTIMKKLKRC